VSIINATSTKRESGSMKANGRISAVGGLTLLVCAGLAMAQPVVDGRRDALYGAPLAVQKSSVVDFEAAPRVKMTIQSNQSNIGGKGVYLTAGTQSGPNDGNPTLVNRGVEMAIRLSELPGAGVGGVIKISGFVNGSGHDFLSNQVFGGLQGDPENLGEPRNVNFSALPGDQFISVSTASRSPVAPVIDGLKDAAYLAQSPAQVTLGTGFGNSSRTNGAMPPSGIRNRANGSEIDGVFAYIYDNGTPAIPSDDLLCLFIAGNHESNFNKLEIFFDVTAGGQATLRRDNSSQSFNALNRMGENADGTNTVASGAIGPGLTFDTGFAADYWVSVAVGGGTEPGAPTMFIDSATLPTGGAGAGAFFQGANALVAGTPVAGILAGGVASDGMTVDIDNSNSSVEAPSGGGVGGRANLPGGGSQADVSAPAGVTTGVELKINLQGIGYPIGNAGVVKIAGIVVGFNYDFMSNQAIGGLTSATNPDPNNLGFQAKDVDFNLWDGNQFVSVAVPASVPAQPSGATIDGAINSSASEQAAYGGALWVNSTNASAFGDSTLGLVDRSNGSELDAVYAYVAADPTNANAPTLYVLVTGNLHDFNKLVLFFDTAPGGQNDLRGDNAGFENFNAGLGGPNGFTFDTGFEADYAIGYSLGFDGALAVARHFADGTQLLTAGGGFGGRFGGGDKLGTASPITGEVIARVGFGNNTGPVLNEGAPNFFDRTVLANGSELDAVYMFVDVPGGAAYFFIAGNLEANLTSVEMFFDTVAGAGQNTLIFSDKNPQDPLYTGNPDVDFGALNRLGGPVLDANMLVTNPGMTFDAGFEPDYFFSFRMSAFQQLGTIPGDGVASIFGNWARLRTLADPIGPMPANSARFLGIAANDSLGGSASFQNGDTLEPINSAAINNRNLGGVGGGKGFLCTDGTQTDPATVARGMEVTIDLADLNWNGTSPIKFTVFLNGSGHGKVSNQILPHGCTNDLGEPRNVNFGSLAGNQFVAWPIAIAPPPNCRLNGDSNADGVVNFADITSVLSNWAAIFSPGTGPGDSNGDGMVNFADITSVLSNWASSAGCN